MDEQLSENDEFKDKKQVENSFQNRGDVQSNVDKVSKPNDDNSYSAIVSGPRDFSQLFAPQSSPTSITDDVQTSINESSSGVVSTCNQTNFEKPTDHSESSDIKKETCAIKENVPKDNPKQIQDDDKANNSKLDEDTIENKAIVENNVNKTGRDEYTPNKQPEIQNNKNKQASQKPNKNKMEDKKKEGQGTSSSSSKEGNSNSKICLKFHIIISCEDLRKNGEVSLALKYAYKDFLSGKGVMTFKRSLADGIQILQYDVDIPKDRLVRNTLAYSYKISKGDISNKSHFNFDWLKKFEELNEWNIYDVFSPSNPQKSIAMMIKSIFVGNQNDNSAVVLTWFYELFPKILDDNPGSGNDFVVEFMGVFLSAKKTLRYLQIEESNLHQIAIASLKELKSKNSNEDLSKAACVLFILMEFKLWDVEITSCLCSWLSIRSDGNKKCFSYDHFCKVFPNDLWKRRIADALLEFLKKIVTWHSVDPNWILTFPFLHFLEKNSKPFQELEIESVHENPKWWGISNIKDLVDNCKKKMSQNMPLDLYLENVTPMFEVDHLLPRSLLAIMSLHHIPRLIGSQMFPLDACLANIIYFVKQYKYGYPGPEELIMNCLIGINELMNKLKRSGCNRENKWDEYLQYILKLTFQFLGYVMDSFYNDEIKLQSINIMTSAICMALNIIEKLDDKDKDNAKGSIHKYFDKTISVIQKHFGYHDPLTFRASLLVCSGLSEFLLESTSMWNNWEQCIKGYFVREFEKILLHDKCQRFSEIMKSTHYAVIKDWTSESMLKEVENWLKRSSGELQIVFEHDKDHTFRDIFDKIVKQIWPEPANDLSILSFTMNNPIFQKLSTLYNVKNLGEESVIKLTRALSLLENVECLLLSGKLNIKSVRVLLNDQKKFLKTVQSVSGVKGDDWNERENQIKKSLQEYECCIEAYEKRCNQIRVLLDFCGKYEMDELQILKNEAAKEINDLCLSDIRGASTSLKIMGIDRGSLDMLKFLECYQESMVLTDLWKYHSRKLLLNLMSTLSDIMDSVYMPSKEDFKTIAKSLNDGTMLMSEVEDRFLRFDDCDLKRELKFFCNDNFYLEICEKIGNYKKLRTCKRGAEVMLEFKEKFELTGSFEDIEQIADIAKRGSLKLCDITNEFVKVCRVLQDFSAIKRRCLEVFIEGKEFVDWLRETLSGSREIKVLVELALSSAEGQGDMEMEKVSCFHAAATAYSSLIYDLEQDMDFRKFLALCEPVWAIANVDAKIAEKFRDAARQLEWFNGIKESHGAVEVNALQSAALINSKGIFTVGNFANNASQLTLEDVVQMKLYLKKGEKDAMEEVSESLDSEKWKIYSLKQLCDLQSKLMLVAGKAHEGRKDIEGFNRTLHGILRLAGIYVELVDRGCCMFISWKVTFFCNPTKSMYARIDFTSDDKTSEYIFGKSSQVDSMKIHERIENMCGVLDTCLEEWNNYIQYKRIEKHFMNFYTTKQLVVLQREIATAFNNKDDESNLGIELFMLLSLICSSCTKNELRSAATSALQQFSKSNDNESQDVAEISDDDKDSMNDFVSAMVEAGFPLSLAEAAERNVISGDVQEGIIWCMENEENIEQEEMGQIHIQKENLQSGKINFHEFLQEETKNLSKKSTSEKIEKKFMDIWRIFLDQIDIGYIDHISLEQLSLVLENLGKENHTSFPRILPFPMKDGKPNLVLCNQSEIWITVLSVYANSSDLALPSVDEVLVCNQNTSAEEIEIMCLRTRKDKSGKLYCLVHAELLDYRVAVSAERFINLIGDGTKFVIVCTSNTHSHIADAFDQHKVKYLPHDMQEIKTYVQHHLTRRNSEYSYIDPEYCSVRLIKSNQAGTGKTLRIKRAVDKISEEKDGNPSFLTLPLQNKEVNVNEVVKSLRRFAVDGKEASARVVHFDISTEVMEGVDCFLFNLLILGSLSDEDGYVWKKLSDDVYFIESYPHKAKGSKDNKESHAYLHKIFSLLPSFNCWSPNDSLIIMKSEIANKFVLDQKVDEKEFRSESFQRVCSYLESEFKPPSQAGPIGSIELLIKFCGVENPSWAELKHFIDFFNTQLLAYEKSIFCQTFMATDLPGFRKFVIDFMLLMSQDFSTRSLKISEESPDVISDFTENMDESLLLGGYEMKRTWETSSHPYLFFNDDGHSFTFIGFVVDRATGNIINPENRKVLLRSAVSQQLFDALHRNNVNLQEDFDRLDRVAKLRKMATIMGLDVMHDPDESYELTADNVKKMMAIYMRFRCGIPVVIMGETGCGKTCLIKYLCNFMKPPFSDMKNMFLMKIHGGTTIQNIVDKIRKVIKIAKENSDQLPGIKTVLFFDEANTTSAIGLIKEAMCDQTIAGESFDGTDLKLVAACNPYRKHSDELINKLEKAGLGYHVSASKTTDRLGTIPMRQLVYRVRSLPPSMFPLVWDFGFLDEDAEKLYIRQMVQRCIEKGLNIAPSNTLVSNITKILVASQSFMRRQNDESSFVSLRDVERCLRVMAWFYTHDNIFAKMDQILLERKTKNRRIEEDEDSEEDADNDDISNMDDLTRSLILALGVCYHACLSKREEYRTFISPHFRSICTLPRGPDTILEEISTCQDVFLNEVVLDKNIARNQALKENLFVMVICIELRIPLFLIGKPGSSKSLAKTVLADAMQGNQSKSKLFQSFKSAHMISYQCSPLSTPEGITGMFRQCAKLQESKDLDKFVSIVVLDEVGLAEDSEKMPLKALHPLLEDGCEDEDESLPHKKVAFIGISNWSLDPAKMNRGIFVQRSPPDEEELCLSACGICSSDPITTKHCEKLFKPLAKGYLKLCETALEIREFFGLRDFYSLIKMISSMSKSIRRTPSWHELQKPILRNFSGLENIDVIGMFKDFVKEVIDTKEDATADRSLVASSLIRESLKEIDLDSESRYLLILMDNYSSFNLLQHDLLEMNEANLIFGSNFPKDLEYTQICRNINRIKIYMETGKTVVLLNLENLYESLYDALNQYYVMFNGERFVDLGLGTQRVKCKVHKSFRLIVVADKEVVYKRFPIPLINRLEKHCLAVESLLTLEQMDISRELRQWADQFIRPSDQTRSKNKLTLADVFIGFHTNALASLVLQAFSKLGKKYGNSNMEEILEHCQDLLLQCAVPEALHRTTEINGRNIYETYFEKQHHKSIMEFLQSYVIESSENIFAQITTHSRLLLKTEVNEMTRQFGLPPQSIEMLSLQAFATEQQFSGELKSFFESEIQSVLIIQCDSGDQNGDLIACTRFIIGNEYSNWEGANDERVLNKHILLIIQLPKVMGGCFVGFQGGKWISYHIDNLQPDPDFMSLLPQMKDKSVSSLLNSETPDQLEDEGNLKQQSESTNKIIESCIHSAAALLRGPVGNLRSRKTARLDPLVRNLRKNYDNDKMLVDILRERVSQLLYEREANVTIAPECWLTREATTLDAVCSAGSFDKSVIQCLESKVTPILAYIIAYIDSYCNLDLLDSSEEFIVNLWFEMFKNTSITSMKYSDIQTISQSMAFQFEVKTFTQDNSLMKCQLPFSWIIKEYLDKLISQHQAHNERMKDIEFDVEDFFNSSEVGRLLERFSPDDDSRQKIFEMYLFDYVKMSYRPSSQVDKELEMVANDLRSIVLKPTITIEDFQDGDIWTLSKVHYIYKEQLLKYKLFAEFVRYCPECIDDLYAAKVNNMSLLQQCLMYVLETLAYNNKVKSVKSWADKVKSLTYVVNQLFHHAQLENLNGLMCVWNRICALKLFIEHNSSNELVDDIIYNRLWAYLGERFNLKSLKCFENVEKFLKSCDDKGLEKCFGKILPSKCCMCKGGIGIISLICEHKYCRECFDEVLAVHNKRCFSCAGIAQEQGDHSIAKEDVDKYVAFKRRLNSFFMAIVSKMCFDGSHPPDDEIIKKLLEKVVFKSETDNQLRTRNLLVGRNDPNPVIRSFLLQLLLKHQMDSVESYLTKFLNDAQNILQNDMNQILELYILCLNCFEDHYQNLGATSANLTDRLEFVKRLWKDNKLIDLCRVSSRNYGLNVTTLKKMALLRYGLKELADGLYGHYIKNNLDECGYCATRSLGDLATTIFITNDQTRLYLMKEITHNFGFKVLLQFAEKPQCKWFLTPHHLKDDKSKEEESTLDHFLLCGGDYKNTRDALFQAMLQKNPSLLDDVKLMDYNLTLAMFRHLHQSTAEAENDVLMWDEYFSENKNLTGKDLVLLLMKHKLKMVAFKPHTIPMDNDLLDLIFHFMVATKFMHSKNIIIELLCIPINTPGSVKDSYLPTMPEDNTFEALQLINQKELAVFYRCPNGHPYSIGDCGQPGFFGRCSGCGQVIGGQNHVLAAGNTNANALADTTSPGHVLGRPINTNNPSGERLMTPLEVSITRLLLHISLYVGSFDFDFSRDAIKPQLNADEVHEYFLVHMEHDLNMIQRSSGQNRDNAFILLHKIINDIHNKRNVPNLQLSLISKAERMRWEEEFVKEYIRPHLENVNELIEKGRKLMLEDDGIVLSPLMKKIYEVDQDNDIPGSLENLHECQLLWKFRVRISREQLLVNLQNSSKMKEGNKEEVKKQYSLLQYFLENINVLQEIRHLPAIMDLHKRLVESLSRRISNDEAKTCTVSEFLKQQEDMTRRSFELLFEEFCATWNTLRSNFCKFAFLRMTVPEMYLKEYLNLDSKIGFFLPTVQGLGICSVGLVHYLIDQQNKLLDVYETVTKQRVMKKVSLDECISIHLLMLEPEKELHTLILANCNYSLEVGRTTKLEYDYANLEMQVVDHFVFDKPRIEPGMKVMNFKEEFNVSRVFAELEYKIPQETKLPEPLENDFKILSDVSTVLLCLTSVLEFIVSVEREPNKNIVDFMINTLKMKNMFEDYPSMTSIQFKHAKQAWLTLSFIQAKLQVKNGRLPFSNVDDKYKEVMSKDVNQRLTNCFQSINVDSLSLILFECILLNVTSGMDEDYDNSRQSLGDILLAYISTKNLDESFNAFLENGSFPKEILACHCFDVWLSMVDPEKRKLLNLS